MRNQFCPKCGINLSFNPPHKCPTSLGTTPTPRGLPKGYEARKNLPVLTVLTKYFPDAWVEVTKVAVAGNVQHNPGEPLHWARGKSMDQLNTALRHIMDHDAYNEVFDTEPPEVLAAIGDEGTMHLAKAAWRILAALQLKVEELRDARRQSEGSGETPAQLVPPKAMAQLAGSKRHGRTKTGLRRGVSSHPVRHRDKATRR